jgi:hypothetical protein
MATILMETNPEQTLYVPYVFRKPLKSPEFTISNGNRWVFCGPHVSLE